MLDALIFSRARTGSTNLVFGEGEAIALNTLAIVGQLPGIAASIRLVESNEIQIAGTLPKPSFACDMVPVTAFAVAATMPGMSMTSTVSYISNTQRPIVGQVQGTAQIAHKTEWGIEHIEHHARKTNTGVESLCTDATASSTPLRMPYQDATPAPIRVDGAFQDGASHRTMLDGLYQEGAMQRPRFDGVFQEGMHVTGSRLSGRFQDGHRDRRPNLTSWFAESRRLQAVRYRATIFPAIPLRWGRHSRFQDAWVPRPGISLVPIPPVPQPNDWGTDLVFACPPVSAALLVFGLKQCSPTLPTGATLYILPARFYMTAHTIVAQRLPDLADVPLYSATIAADAGSFCWSLNASGPASLFELLAPNAGLPAQLRVTLDGIPFVFAVDAISRNAQFGQTGVTVQGRSVTALIGAPYLRATTRNNAGGDRTAQQLALDALTLTGVDLDWGVGAGAAANAGLVDWLVPAGAWSHMGTPLAAVQAIAGAAGGYVQSHRSAPTLIARHPYGTRAGDVSVRVGWSLGVADVELASDAIITESVQRQDGADINGVYISGTSAGVLAWVKRAGSAGNNLAAMVTDPLNTHVDVARQRGLAILGAAGSKYQVQIDIPVLTGSGQPGVLDVGQLVQVNASAPWRGRVRAVTVNARRPSLRQTVTLERHIA